MAQDGEKSSLKEKIGVLVFALVFIGLGVFAIIDPSAMEGAEAGGRRAWLKQLVVSVWGRPFGIVATVLGLLLIVGAFRGKSDENE